MESILTSIKKLLGIVEEYENFDSDIIMNINSSISILNQLGVGPTEGFSIRDKNSLWSDFIGNDSRLEMIKMYVYFKVKLAFDPPLGSASIEAINRQISELEWRITICTDELNKEANTYFDQIVPLTNDVEVLKQHDILSSII